MTGKRFTFLMDPEDFKIFFQSPNLDFQQAVQQPVQKTGIAHNYGKLRKNVIELHAIISKVQIILCLFSQEAYQKLHFGIIILNSMIQSNIS